MNRCGRTAIPAFTTASTPPMTLLTEEKIPASRKMRHMRRMLGLAAFFIKSSVFDAKEPFPMSSAQATPNIRAASLGTKSKGLASPWK